MLVELFAEIYPKTGANVSYLNIRSSISRGSAMDERRI